MPDPVVPFRCALGDCGFFFFFFDDFFDVFDDLELISDRMCVFYSHTRNCQTMRFYKINIPRVPV